MFALITQQNVEERMGLGWVPQAKAVIDSAILAAHLRVQAELDTKLDKQTNTDLFYLDWTKLRVIPDGFFRLRLKNGFLRASPAPIVTYGVTADAAITAVTGYQVHMERGFVFVPAAYQNAYVQIVYESGFALDNDGALDTVPPDALKEAILGLVPAVIEFSSTTEANKSIGESSQKAAVDHAMSVLMPYRRRMGLSLNPVY
jgi:hypothetical protein